MKIIQIINNGSGLFALTENGDIYFGFFDGGSAFTKPAWGWRKVPDIVGSQTYQFARMKESTEGELLAAEVKHKLAYAQASKELEERESNKK